jgi:hypothetical protein
MVRVLVFALVFCAVFPTLSDCREPDYSGAIWEKSIKARQGQPRSCFYGTVTGRSDQEYSNGTLTIGFTKLASDHKYAEAQFSFLPWKRMKDFKLEDGYGDVLEACVSPGRYSIPGLLYSTGSYAVGPYSASRPRNFAPIEFELEAGKNYYIGTSRCCRSTWSCTIGSIATNRLSRNSPSTSQTRNSRSRSSTLVRTRQSAGNSCDRVGPASCRGRHR